MDYPKLRAVEAIPAQDDTVCLRDPLGISDKLVFVPREVLFIVSLFDGRHSILDIQAEFTRRFGSLLFSERVKDIIEKLDGCLLLEGDRFEEAKRKLLEEYRGAPVRAATHAGAAYEGDASVLRAQIDGFFGSPEGPGVPAAGGREPDDPPGGRLVGLIAPHIDLRRGGTCYAWSYAELGRRSVASTFVVLGISHVQTSRRFVLTRKDFDTPLGVVPVDAGIVDALSGKLRTDFFEDELVHRSEHSIEFQALCLRYLYPDRRDMRIVPILCASRDEVASGLTPDDDPEFSEFCSALASVIAGRGDEVCVVAGVDLSHLGRRFGQNLTMTKSLLERAERDDMEMIRPILERDASTFFKHIMEEKDRRNVCGVPAIYTLLTLMGSEEAGPSGHPVPIGAHDRPPDPSGVGRRAQGLGVLPAASARLLRYEQAVDYAAHSVVTYMSAAFYA